MDGKRGKYRIRLSGKLNLIGKLKMELQNVLWKRECKINDTPA